MQTIFSGFKQFADANAAVQELQERGIDQEALNVLVEAQTAKSNLDTVNQARVHVDVTDAIGVQELTGLALLVMNERPVNVRGLGPVLAAGTMADILVSSTTANGQSGEDVQSMLQSYGVPAQTAERYHSLVASGGVLLWVRSEGNQISTVSDVLRRHHAQQVMTNQQQ
jgi:hypothetical protein